MDNIQEKFLPIGTIVKLKEANKRLMITGFCLVANNDKSVIYDYSGVAYPEGLSASDETALFNHEQIEKIFYTGFIDSEEIEFKKRLKHDIESLNMKQ